MKKIPFVLLYLLCLVPFSSCDEDEEKNMEDEVAIENPLTNLDANIPVGLSSSDDPYAQAANAMVISATSFAAIGSAYFSNIEQASSATSPLPGGIGTCSYYEYTAGGSTVAYQACEDDTNYYLDVYYQEESTLDKVFELEQKKDGTSGTMEITSGISYIVSWSASNEELKMSIEYDNVLVYELISNQKTGSGSVVFYEENASEAKQVFEWDANGAGTYTSFDSDGAILESASWS